MRTTMVFEHRRCSRRAFTAERAAVAAVPQRRALRSASVTAHLTAWYLQALPRRRNHREGETG